MICRLVDISGNKMSTFVHIAYGSDLHTLRLKKRTPSARLLGVARVEGRKLLFHKQSSDGSAKCNMLRTDSPKDAVHVAVFEISHSEKVKLDTSEGLGEGCREEPIRVVIDDSQLTGLAYIADDDAVDDSLMPYDWYKEMVLLGAEYHGFPEEYLQAIKAVPSRPDRDKARSAIEWTIVKDLKEANNALQLMG